MSWGFNPGERRNVWIRVTKDRVELRMDEDFYTEHQALTGMRSLKQAVLTAVKMAIRRAVDACPMKYYVIRASVSKPVQELLEGQGESKTYKKLVDYIRDTFTNNYWSSPTVIFKPASEDEVDEQLDGRAQRNWGDNDYKSPRG